MVKQSATTNCLDMDSKIEFDNIKENKKENKKDENKATDASVNSRKSASLPRDYKDSKNGKSSDKQENLDKFKETMPDIKTPTIFQKSNSLQKSKSKKFYKSKKSIESSSSVESRSVSRSQSGNDIMSSPDSSATNLGNTANSKQKNRKKFRAGVIGVELEECQKRLQGWDRVPVPVPIREVVDELETRIFMQNAKTTGTPTNDQQQQLHKALDTENLYKLHPSKSRAQLNQLVQEYSAFKNFGPAPKIWWIFWPKISLQKSC